MKKLSEFDTLSDFGYTAKLSAKGKVEYIKCSQDEGTLSNDLANPVYPNGDAGIGKFFSLTEILSGGSITVPMEDSVLGDQAELSLNYNLATSLAYLGSVYSTVLIAIRNIGENYPNGFLIASAITGVSAMMFNASDTYMYDGIPFTISDYTDYEIVQLYNGVFDAKFTITQQIADPMFSLFLELDGQPSDGPGYDWAIQPKDSTLDRFYSTLSQYELDLLVPPYDRTNYWPRDLVATNNILRSGARYDAFIAAELDWASLADDEESNFIWRKLYPDGQKLLDNDDGLMQKLVLALAMNFDNIKRYQDQLKYQHTIGYDRWDHISKDLVELLARQWNWSLGHNLNQDDYSQYLYSTYENYITGYSSQKISARDVNFEIWRRVLANLVTLYKKKGTKEAIKYIANIYGLPEDLLRIEELVEATIDGFREIVESESNIVVPISGQMYFIDDSGSAKTLSYPIVKNTKYLNLNISPVDAIEFDLYDWGLAGHPSIYNTNGILTALSGVPDATVSDYFRRIHRATIKSDGSARYDSRYPLLESEGGVYYASSVNKMTVESLEPYMNFLDDNWNVMMSNLVPAGSRILSIGTLYKNPMWRREKHQWNDSELDAKPLPLNEDFQLHHVTPTIEVIKTKTGVIEIPEPAVEVHVPNYGRFDEPTLTSTKSNSMSAAIPAQTHTAQFSQSMLGNVPLEDPAGQYIEAIVDGETIAYEYSSTTFEIASPMFEPVSGQSGTTLYVDYTEDALVVTNQTTFDVVFSAYNLSDSGYTKLEVDLFRKESDTPIVVDESRTYSIMTTSYETDGYGIYKVSSLLNIDLYDFISVDSEYLPTRNKLVQVTHIDTGTSQMRTTPSIGLFNLSTGEGSNVVNWTSVQNSGAIDRMGTINKMGGSIFDIIEVMRRISSGATGSDLFSGLSIKPNLLSMFEWFTWQDIGIVYGSLLILEFLKGNKTYSFDTSDHILINMVSTGQAKATFKRVVNFFNWAGSVQSIGYSNYPRVVGNFAIPTISTNDRSAGNAYSTTGTVTFGGLDDLNSEILKDKTEYFYRHRAITHAPKTWGDVSGLVRFPVAASGGTLLDSGFDLNYVNGIKYYGRYFMFMRTPNVPIATMEGLRDGVSTDASVSVRWNGVGDSDRLELQYLMVSSSNTPYSTYSSIPSSAWTGTSAVTANVPARLNVGDDYIYTVQTTLHPDTYYWWRVKNFRSKINMFGHNLEYFTSTQPLVFKTGGFSGGGRNEGELPQEAAPPTGIGGGKKTPTAQA